MGQIVTQECHADTGLRSQLERIHLSIICISLDGERDVTKLLRQGTPRSGKPLSAISNSDKQFLALDIPLHQTHFWPMFIVKNVEIIYIFNLYFSKKNLKGKILSYFKNIFFNLQTSQKTCSELWANFNNFDLQKWPNDAWKFMVSRSIFVSIPTNKILYIVIKWRTI